MSPLTILFTCFPAIWKGVSNSTIECLDVGMCSDDGYEPELVILNLSVTAIFPVGGEISAGSLLGLLVLYTCVTFRVMCK